MPSVLLCARTLEPADLGPTLLGATDVEHHVARGAGQALSVAATARIDLILLERDLPEAVDLVRRLRSEPVGRVASIVVLADRTPTAREAQLLGAGANAILRLPACPAWDERLATLLAVPSRRTARLPVHIRVPARGEAGREIEGSIENVSLRGVLLECPEKLPLDETLGLTFSLPTSPTPLTVRGRVVRRDTAGRYGIGFDDVPAEAAKAIRTFTG